MTRTIISETDSYIYSCPSGQTIIEYLPVVMCSPGDCSVPSQCVIDERQRSGCQEPPEEIANTVAKEIPSDFAAIHYHCEEGLVWLSGYQGGHITICFDGQWTNFYDYCVVPAEMKRPTECSNLVDNFDKTYWYRIYYKASEPMAVNVICELENPDPNDNGWTAVYYTPDTSFPGRNNFYDLGRFFTSVEVLYSITKNKDEVDVDQPYVLQILITQGSETFHATYDGFVVGETGDPPGYVLQSVGQYHGNAGDALRSNVGATFKGVEGFGWFIEGLSSAVFMDITNIEGTYGSLALPSASNIYIRVRPKDFDAGRACPPILPYDFITWHDDTNVIMPISRAPGNTLTYSCTKMYYQEGQDGGTRTIEGNVTCLQSSTGETPQWDKAVFLPCNLVCPEGYLKILEPEEVCYKVSENLLGYFEAVRSCVKDNATLMSNPNHTLLADHLGDGFHFTAHTQRGLSTFISPELLTPCEASCQPTEPDMCLTMNKYGVYVAVNCQLVALPYICQYPGRFSYSISFLQGNSQPDILYEFGYKVFKSIREIQENVADGMVYSTVSCTRRVKLPCGYKTFWKHADCHVLKGFIVIWELTNCQDQGLASTITASCKLMLTRPFAYAFDIELNSKLFNKILKACAKLKPNVPHKAISWSLDKINAIQKHIKLTKFNNIQGDVTKIIKRAKKTNCAIDPMPISEVIGERNCSSLADMIMRIANTSINKYNTQFYFSINDIDDTTETLNIILSSVREWMTIKHLKLNQNKTEFMVVGKENSTRNLGDIQININNNSVPISSKVRDLGVSLDCNFCFSAQMNNVENTAGNCPFGYSYLDGKCFKYIPTTDVLQGLYECQTDGGGLFLPETLSDIDKAEKFLVSNLPDNLLTSLAVYTGINHVWGDWTMQGFYEPNVELQLLLGNYDTLYWRILHLHNITRSFEPFAIDPTIPPPSSVVLCEYPFPSGCLEDPPLPYENMEFVSHYTTDFVLNGATYRCLPGFFMDENYTISQLDVECYGQLGGWSHFKIQPCLPSPCIMPPPVPLSNMTYDHDSSVQTVVITGYTISYTCEANYITNYTTLDTTQNVTCFGIELGWIPLTPLPCLPSMCGEPPLPLGNMTYNYIVNSSYYLGDQLTYSCQLGYFVNGSPNIFYVEQNLTCGGIIYGWNSRELIPCLPREVCLEDPMVTEGTFIWEATSRYYQGQVGVLCSPGLQTASGLTVQKLNCSYLDMNNSYYYNTSTFMPCNACNGVISITNATTDWNENDTWLIDEEVTGNCDFGYETSLEVSNFSVKCLSSGWDTMPECYRICPDPLPPGENMNVTTPFHNRVGAVHEYVCEEGLYIPTNQHLPMVINKTNVTCTEEGLWVPNDEPVACVNMCPEEPVIENATVAWDPMRLWMEQHVITVTCIESHIFPSGKISALTVCTPIGWEPLDGCYGACMSPLPVGTDIVPEALTERLIGTIVNYTCKPGTHIRLTEVFRTISDESQVKCDSDLSWKVIGQPLLCEPLMVDPPALNIEGVTPHFLDGPYYLGQTLTVYCDEGMLSAKGTNHSVFTNTLDGWVLQDPDFECYEVSYMPPLGCPTSTFMDFNPPYHVNQTMVVTCDIGSLSNTGNPSTVYRYSTSGWDPTEPEFYCFPVFCFIFGCKH
ncbi:uncharacterized protein [Palaemon carinicauda]|uniref:uncharacterized protein n=1 Tax=Palaemon carinicauda TaxID=392227 RepID=UPI0035B576ED